MAKATADLAKVCTVCGIDYLAYLEESRACSRRCRLRLWRATQPRPLRRSPGEARGRKKPRTPEQRTYDTRWMREHYRMKSAENREEHLSVRRAYIEIAKSRVGPEAWKRRTKAYNLKKYGLTLGAYEKMLADQLSGCAICGKAPTSGRPLHVDHDHETGRVRGLLCSKCNQAMKAVDAYPEWPLRAQSYWLRHQAREG